MDISEFSRLENKGLYARHPWETSRKDVLAKLLKDSEISFPIGRIVDIGGGDAYVIHTLVSQNLAAEYVAIDTAFTHEVIAQLKHNYSHSKVQYVQDLEQYFKQYDNSVPTLFLCMDVLEHLKSEDEILDYLKTGNHYYFFAVPAFQSVFSDHDVLLGHYRRYTLPQLRKVLESHHFAIIDKGYYFTSLLIFRWLDRLINKNKKASIDNWTGGKFKTSILNGILKADFAVSRLLQKAGITPYGLSCYCLCKK